MGNHAEHQMHEHSIASFRQDIKKFGQRNKTISLWLLSNKIGTDREIMLGCGFREPNQVRPRITELIKQGYVYQIGKKYDPITDRMVRLVALNVEIGELH